MTLSIKSVLWKGLLQAKMLFIVKSQRMRDWRYKCHQSVVQTILNFWRFIFRISISSDCQMYKATECPFQSYLLKHSVRALTFIDLQKDWFCISEWMKHSGCWLSDFLNVICFTAENQMFCFFFQFNCNVNVKPTTQNKQKNPPQNTSQTTKIKYSANCQNSDGPFILWMCL